MLLLLRYRHALGHSAEAGGHLVKQFPRYIDRTGTAMRNILSRTEEAIAGTYAVSTFVFTDKEQHGTAAI